MQLKKFVILFLIVFFINLINGQNEITFSIELIDCGSSITVGLDQCLFINSCGYQAVKVTADDAIMGSYTASFYDNQECTDFIPANLIMFSCPSDGFPGKYKVTCNTPGVTTHSSFASSLASILSGVTSILSTVSSISSSTSTGGSGASSITTVISAASNAASSLSSAGSSTSGGGGGGGVKGATCDSEKSKSTVIVTYNSNSPYIQCNGSPDMLCSNSLCTSVLPNYTITCMANSYIDCTGISMLCSIGGIEVCELNWQYSTTTTTGDSNSDSKANFSPSKFNNIFSFSNLFLISFSIITITPIIINNF